MFEFLVDEININKIPVHELNRFLGDLRFELSGPIRPTRDFIVLNENYVDLPAKMLCLGHLENFFSATKNFNNGSVVCF